MTTKLNGWIFWGAFLCVAAIALGFLMGCVFGAAEDKIKASLENKATAVFETVYQNDAAKKETTVKKSWDYFKRAHMHWGAIGSAGLSCVIVLVLFCRPGFCVNSTALLLGLGAIVYPLFWLLAGIYAPELGSTGAAKKMFEWIGLPGSIACLSGVFGTLVCLVKSRLSRSDS